MNVEAPSPSDSAAPLTGALALIEKHGTVVVGARALEKLVSLEARVARGDSVAAAAYAAAAAAAAAAGAQTWPGSAPSSPPAPHGTLAEAPAVSEGRGRAEPEIPLSFRHRITWDPRGVC